MTGAKLHYLECTSEGELTDEELQKGINERTRLVTVAQVSNVLGCVNPLQKITEMAHRVGAVVVVDAPRAFRICRSTYRRWMQIFSPFPAIS